MSYRVVVVEGETTAVWTVTQLLALNRPDLILESYSNPSKALEHVQRNLPALLISDVQMTQQNGLEFLQAIRLCAPTLPVIVVTGVAEPVVREQSLNYGVSAYFTKPFAFESFLAAVERWAPAPANTNWQELLTESGHLLESKTRSNFDNPSLRLNKPVTASLLTVAGKPAIVAAQIGATAPARTVAAPPPLLAEPVPEPPAPPAVEALPAATSEQLKQIGQHLFEHLADVQTCLVVDLAAHQLLFSLSNFTLDAANEAKLVDAACGLFKAAPTQQLVQAGLLTAADHVGEAGPQEIQMVFATQILFGKASRQGRVAVLLVAERSVNIGLGWAHLKSALAEIAF